MASRQPETRPDWALLLCENRARLGLTGLVMARKLEMKESTYRHLELGNGGQRVMTAELVQRLGGVIGADEAEKILRSWKDDRSSGKERSQEDAAILLPAILQRGLVDARVTRFHPSRRYYQLNREGRAHLGLHLASKPVCRDGQYQSRNRARHRDVG